MGLIIGGILTGIIVPSVITLFRGQISGVLVVITEIVGAGALVYFGLIKRVIPMKFTVASLASYLVASIILGFIMRELDD
jgi:hypothetical protein